MEIEVIHEQITAKVNHYQAVPGKNGTKRIIKDEKIREYERLFISQCKIQEQVHFKPFPVICPGVP